MKARDINLSFIGRQISYVNNWNNYVLTDEITMIMLKKNNTVLIRHGKSNRQETLRAEQDIELLQRAGEKIEYTVTI